METDKYTIEQLVEMAQGGRDELYLDIWLRVKGRIWTIAKNRYQKMKEGTAGFDNGGIIGGVDAEDLYQAGFLALVDAIRTFDGSREIKFTSWLHYYLKKEFRAAEGIRTKRRDPLDKCLSYDRPSSPDNEDLGPLSDTIPSGRDDYATVNEEVYNEQLHGAIEAALDMIPTREAEAIRRAYFAGETYKEIAKATGVSVERVRQIINAGIATLRRQRAKNRLEEFLLERFDYYHGVGVKRYIATGERNTEKLALKRIEAEERFSIGT